MAKRDSETTRANGGTTPADTMEQRVAAFAEQLGRNRRDVAREGRRRWLDREAPTKQIASVRDSAAELLEQLADSAMKASKSNPVATAALDTTKGRSGGVVDAPGKKHRKPMRTDPGANITDSQAAKMRMARTMVKTHRRRGRG